MQSAPPPTSEREISADLPGKVGADPGYVKREGRDPKGGAGGDSDHTWIRPWGKREARKKGEMKQKRRKIEKGKVEN